MCRWALISWPIEESAPNNLYLILGEFYNREIRDDISVLSEFYRDLQYFYPFRFSVGKNICYNFEDIFSLQKKYGLTAKSQLVGQPTKKVLTMRTPVLYDITCMVPLFPKRKRKISYKQKNDEVCIILPYSNPVHRGKLLEDAVNHGPSTFVVIGNIRGQNRDSIATLASRYLLTCGVPQDRIIKMCENKQPECILEAIEVVNMSMVDSDYDIAIACRHDNIQEISKTIRYWRRTDILVDRKISYLCPFD